MMRYALHRVNLAEISLSPSSSALSAEMEGQIQVFLSAAGNTQRPTS
jgi:hypothetical protein